MKKTIVIILLSLLMVGCLPISRKPEPKQSVAKEAVWDVFLVGSWSYTEANSDDKTDFPQGTETFYGDGKYVCNAVDENGKEVTIKGRWRLDDEEDFVVWVTQKFVKSGKKTLSSEKKSVKYVVNSLAPNKTLVYQVGDVYRSAEWVE